MNKEDRVGYLHVARIMYEKTLSHGVLFVRCNVNQTSLGGDGISASVDVLDFEKGQEEVAGQEGVKWNALLHYSFDTFPIHSNHRHDDVASKDGMLVSVFSGKDLLESGDGLPKPVLNEIADILEKWRVCELGFPHRLYGEEKFDGRISRRGSRKDGILIDGVGATHHVVLPFLTQSLGRFCGRWNIHRENNQKGLCGEIVDQALDSFLSRYGALVTQAQKQQMNYLFGKR